MSKTTTLPASEIATLTGTIRAEAEAKHAQYPQYVGHWNGWGLVKVTRRIRTKFGMAFEKGELALGKRDEPIDDPGLSPETLAQVNKPRWVVYSRRNGIDTLIALKKGVEVVLA